MASERKVAKKKKEQKTNKKKSTVSAPLADSIISCNA
jgi:hypothetical protein